MEDKQIKAPIIVSLEDHYVFPGIWDTFSTAMQDKYRLLKEGLMDVGEERIKKMDAAAISYQVVSHVDPGVKQVTDKNEAINLATKANDYLHSAILKYPNRLGGFAELPLQSPTDAAKELERAVVKLDFKGAMINGHFNGRYLSEDYFSPILAKAQELGVPIYIHPTDPPAEICQNYFDNTDSIITGWAWQIETSTHLIKMINAGIFDKFPNLKIIIGHMGELIPYGLTRLNLGLTLGNWMMKKEKPGMNVYYYLKNNIFITSSGVFDEPVFKCAKEMLGIENLMFSVDYPFRDNIEATQFLNKLTLSTEDRKLFAGTTAINLLKIDCLHVEPQNLSKSSVIEQFKIRMKSNIARYLLGKLVK